MNPDRERARRESRDARTNQVVRKLAAILADIGCEVGPEALAAHTPADRQAASRWAQAILFGEDDAPARPAWLAAHDCRRCRRCGCTDARGCPEGCCWVADDLCDLCRAPGRLRDLVPFLARRPYVRCDVLDGQAAIAHPVVERFLREDAAGLWFVREDAAGVARDVFLPVNCRRGAAGAHESGLAFDPDGFTLTKFGRSIRYTYLRGPNP